MELKALCSIYTGADRHPAGSVFSIDDAEGAVLVARGFAVAVKGGAVAAKPAEAAGGAAAPDPAPAATPRRRGRARNGN